MTSSDENKNPLGNEDFFSCMRGSWASWRHIATMVEAAATAGRVFALCVLVGTLSTYVWLKHPIKPIGGALTGSPPIKAAWSILVGPGRRTGLRLTLRSLYDNVLIYHPHPVLLFYVRPGRLAVAA